MAYDGNGKCSECYETGYHDAFETIIEHFEKSQDFYSCHGAEIAAEVKKLLKRELPHW